jgi:uncharacterized protein YyaL (SSP411 family)
MGYDQSQLARVYLHAWQLTGDEFYRTITEEILDYVVREMTDAAGGFYSTQDADSEGKEGKFFVWTPDEICGVLRSEADAFMSAYGVTQHGNFEGKNILEFVGDLEHRPALADARHKLFEAREQRIHPGRDEKVLTSWNGLMLAAFAEAARALDRDDGSRALAASYRLIAEHNAEFLLSELRQENSRLLRTWKRRPEHAEGAGEAKLNGYLEDYSYLIEGLLELYQTTFEPRWFVAAHELAETLIAHFQAPEGGFFDTSDDHEALITRPRDLQDNATPSGNAVAVTALLKLAGLSNENRYVDLIHKVLTTPTQKASSPYLCPYTDPRVGPMRERGLRPKQARRLDRVTSPKGHHGCPASLSYDKLGASGMRYVDKYALTSTCRVVVSSLNTLARTYGPITGTLRI